MSNHFFELSNLPERIEDGICLDTVVLEQEIQTTNGGIDLSNPNQNYNMDEDFLRQFVPHFFTSKSDLPSREKIFTIIDRYPGITSPCSILVDSVQDIRDLMIIGYQTAHFHYILGKKHNIKESFPNGCCGYSSLNLMLSLIEFGYPNTAHIYSYEYDHGYIALPFVFQNADIQGSIIIDPTSDQLWKNTNTRNAVFIKLGTKWEYRIDREDSEDLFPDQICSIDTLRKISESMISKGIFDYYHYHKNGEKYFKKAFSNPLQIPINREQLLI